MLTELKKRPRRLRMESLETRRVLAATLDIHFGDEGIIQVEGANRTEPLAVIRDGSAIVGDVGNGVGSPGLVEIDSDSFPATSVTLVPGDGLDLVDLAPLPGGGYFATARPSSGSPYATTIYQLNADGSLDTSFGDAIDGSTERTGSRSFLLEDSSSVATFGGPTRYQFESPSITLDSAGNLIVAGRISGTTLTASDPSSIQTINFDAIDFEMDQFDRTGLSAVVRLNAAGAIDTSFGDSGMIQSVSYVRDIVAADNGDLIVVSAVEPDLVGFEPEFISLLAASYVEWHTRVERFLPDGTPDTGFGELISGDVDGNRTGSIELPTLANFDALSTSSHIDAAALTSDGSLLLTGYQPAVLKPFVFDGDTPIGIPTLDSAMQVAKLTPNGELDTSFGNRGISESLIDLETVGANATISPFGASDIPITVAGDTAYIGVYTQDLVETITTNNEDDFLLSHRASVVSFPVDDVSQTTSTPITESLNTALSFYPIGIDVNNDEVLVAGITTPEAYLNAAFENNGILSVGVVKLIEPTAPDVAGLTANIAENSAAGTPVGTILSTDVDDGDVASYSIGAGNVDSAFQIDSVSGEITVAPGANLDFETLDSYSVEIIATDRFGLTTSAIASIQLTDESEASDGPIRLEESVLVITGNDDGTNVTVFVRSGQIVVRSSLGEEVTFDPAQVEEIAITGGSGNDRLVVSPTVDVPVFIDAGDGDDVIAGGASDDTLLGGAGNDIIFGRQGSDLITGGDGRDAILGGAGVDALFGGDGRDILFGQGGSDLLLGGLTIYDDDVESLQLIRDEWNSGRSYADRVRNLREGTGDVLEGTNVELVFGETIFSDGDFDRLIGGNARDFFL